MVVLAFSEKLMLIRFTEVTTFPSARVNAVISTGALGSRFSFLFTEVLFFFEVVSFFCCCCCCGGGGASESNARNHRLFPYKRVKSNSPTIFLSWPFCMVLPRFLATSEAAIQLKVAVYPTRTVVQSINGSFEVGSTY